jgi:rhamnogalacturonan endolyase
MALFAVTSAPAQVQTAPSSPGGREVTITDSGKSVTLSNGLVSATFDKRDGNFLRLEYDGTDLLDRSGYWHVYGNTPGKPETEATGTSSVLTVTQDPATNGGDCGEIQMFFPYAAQAGEVPLDIAIRYTLRRGDSGIYCWTSVHHKPAYPPFDIEIANLTLKLRGDIFDHLTIDAARDRQMISGYDWVHGLPLNLKEARRMTTGIHTGEVEHKYDYSAMFSQTPAYGWISTSKDVGIWMVNPSLEYINGGPTKIELTGHIDVKDALPADPTLLFIWHGSHYGGMPISIQAGEDWSKIAGPFLIYCNHGSNPDAMWSDALTRAAIEQKQWPYQWANAPGYAKAPERGAVRGQLVVKDPQQPGASSSGAWIGLAAPPYPGVDLDRKATTITWQTDGKHYEYWTRADKDGDFNIPNVRPGNYVLYAFNDGILGEFSRVNIVVQEGNALNLGVLTWTPVRYGRQVWEIGVPDRSAGEFRHGSQPWVWGLYNLYPQEFPNDVNFLIGKSDWSKDWNYVQPPRQDATGQWHGTTWKITFNMPQVIPGTAMLRLALCGTRNTKIDAAVNGRSIGTTGLLPSSGAMHRDAMRSIEFECNLPFDTSLLVPGVNIMTLTTHAKAWTDGVEYDYLRLEETDSPSAKSTDNSANAPVSP